MKATPGQQQLLLKLQEFDTETARLRRRFGAIPERAELSAIESEHRTAKEAFMAVQREVDAQSAEIARFESDVDTVRARRERDATLLAASTSPKEAQALQSEIEHLERRQAELEDRELELMEANEATQTQFDAAAQALTGVESRRDALAAAIRISESELQAALADTAEQRAGLAAEVQGDLLALYDETRTQVGLGAARLRGNVSEGSNMALAPAELANIRSAAPDEIVFCPGSGSILVREEHTEDAT